MTIPVVSCIICKSARAYSTWRSRVAGRARTIGNRVYPKRVSRVQIPPSPPRKIPLLPLKAGKRGTFLYIVQNDGHLKSRLPFFNLGFRIVYALPKFSELLVEDKTDLTYLGINGNIETGYHRETSHVLPIGL